MIREQGHLISLKTWPVHQAGFDPAKNKVLLPDFEQLQSLRKPWVEDWNKTYG